MSSEKTEMQKRIDAEMSGEVLGVLTGQVPVRSMPVTRGDAAPPLEREEDGDDEALDGYLRRVLIRSKSVYGHGIVSEDEDGSA